MILLIIFNSVVLIVSQDIQQRNIRQRNRHFIERFCNVWKKMSLILSLLKIPVLKISNNITPAFYTIIYIHYHRFCNVWEKTSLILSLLKILVLKIFKHLYHHFLRILIWNSFVKIYVEYIQSPMPKDVLLNKNFNKH